MPRKTEVTSRFDEEVIEHWYSDAEAQRGAQQVYSDRCVEAIMMIKTVFKQPYRQARGFTQGLLQLMGLETLRVPSYVQLNRQFRTLDISSFAISQNGPVTIAIDSTG